MASRVKWLAEERYATKQFSDEKIPDNDVQLILDTIRLAPSSLGLQPYTIYVIRDEQTKQKLLPASNNQPQITSCSHLLIFCARTDIEERMAQHKALLQDYHSSEATMESFEELKRLFRARVSPEQLLCWAQHQLYIALGYAVLSVKDFGYDSCPMEGFDSHQYHRILGLPPHEHATVLLAVGVAADAPGVKMRFDDVFQED